MSLWADIQPYLDPATGLLMAPDGGKDNLVLLSAYLMREMLRLGEIDDVWRLQARIVAYVNQNRIEPGLVQNHVGMKQYLALVAEGTCGWIGERVWGLSCLFTCLTTSGSSDALTLSLQVDEFETAKKAGWATRYFRKKFKIKTLYAMWFQNTAHPMVLYAGDR